MTSAETPTEDAGEEDAAALEAEAIVAEATGAPPPVAEEDRLATLEALCFAAAEPLTPARLGASSGCARPT